MTDLQQLRKGSTNLLILSILAQGPKHGYAIMRELEEQSEGYFTMTAALLYPALHQLEQDGLVEAAWESAPTAEAKRRRKVYQITSTGLEHLEESKLGWQQFVERLFKTIGGSAATQG